MVSRLVGDQWLEGDVSCSVVRRVVFPGVFFAYDGMCESALTVLKEMEIFQGVIEKELEHYLPFLSSTRFLMEAVKKGMGRERAHGLIKKHALSAVREVRGGGDNRFVHKLSEDDDFPLNREKIEELLRPDHGLAEDQVTRVYAKISEVTRKFPKEVIEYLPEPIL